MAKSFVGLALPAVRDAGYAASRSTEDRAYGDLLIALFTPRGARPMDRSFGTILTELLFDPGAEQDDPTISYVVRDAAARYVPQVDVGTVQVTPVVEQGKKGVRIVFSLASDPAGRVPGQGVGFPRPLPLPNV
jgi:phage baseplate assembly protein W